MKGGQYSVYHGHGYRKGYIGMSDEGDDVRRSPTRAAAHKDDTNGNFRRQGQERNKDIGQKGHDGKLQDGPDGNRAWIPKDISKVFGLKAHAHAKHDDSQKGGDKAGVGFHGRWEENP